MPTNAESNLTQEQNFTWADPTDLRDAQTVAADLDAILAQLEVSESGGVAGIASADAPVNGLAGLPAYEPMSVTEHVAILRPRYIDAILGGTKVIELRLSTTRAQPWGRINTGDVIHIRPSGEGYRGVARVSRVQAFAGLTQGGLEALRRRYEPLIRAGDGYWAAHTRARFATLIWLEGVTPSSDGPALPRSHGHGWFVVEPVRRAA